MKTWPHRSGENIILPLALGLSDGILNALVLASGALLQRKADVSVLLGARVGVAALVTAAFAIYVAKYAELRGQLARSSRQLNLASRGYLATTALGHAAVREALSSMTLASGASFLGAFLPLTFGALFPGPSWVPLAIAIAALGLLGGALGTAVGGNRACWAGLLTVGGAAVAAVGFELHIT